MSVPHNATKTSFVLSVLLRVVLLRRRRLLVFVRLLLVRYGRRVPVIVVVHHRRPARPFGVRLLRLLGMWRVLRRIFQA